MLVGSESLLHRFSGEWGPPWSCRLTSPSVKVLPLHPARASLALCRLRCCIHIRVFENGAQIRRMWCGREGVGLSHMIYCCWFNLKELRRHSVRDCFWLQRGLNFQDIRICFKLLGRKVKKRSPYCTIQSFIIRYWASGNVGTRWRFLHRRKEESWE